MRLPILVLLVLFSACLSQGHGSRPSEDATGSTASPSSAAQCARGDYWWHQPGLFRKIGEWHDENNFQMTMIPPPHGLPLPALHPWAPANISNIGKSEVGGPELQVFERTVTFDVSYRFTDIRTYSLNNQSHDRVQALFYQVYDAVSSETNDREAIWSALRQNETQHSGAVHQENPPPVFQMKATWNIKFDILEIEERWPPSRLRNETNGIGWAVPIGGSSVAHSYYEGDLWRLHLNTAYIPGGTEASPLDTFWDRGTNRTKEEAKESASAFARHYNTTFEPLRDEFRLTEFSC